MNSEYEKTKHSYNINTLDMMAILDVWSAPWPKCEIELMTLKEEWNQDEIELKIRERTKHPDFKVSVNIAYPKKGWIENLIEQNNLSMGNIQKLALLLNDMANGFSGAWHIFHKPSEEDAKISESILKEAISAILAYAPEGLDKKGLDLYERNRSSSIRLLKTSLGVLLSDQLRTREAEQILPGISDPASLAKKIDIVEMLKTAQETDDYWSGKVKDSEES